MDAELGDGLQNRSWEDYWALAKRRYLWIVVPAFTVWAISLGVSWSMTPKYKSETVILVEQPKIPSQYVTPNVAIDLQTRLQSLSEQILSRTRLLRIVADLRLYKPLPTDPEATVQRMRKDIELSLVNSGQNELSGFKISYSASDPHVAQDVAGRLSSLFIEENLQKQQQLSQDTTSFLESELQEARADLERQEAQLRDYRSRFLGELPEQLQGNMQILGGLQARLDGATQALSHAEQQRTYLTSLLQQYRGPRGVTGSLSIDQQLDRLQAQLADANARYTPKHPDVVHLKEQIAVMENQKRHAEQNARAAEDSGLVTAAGPVDAPAAQLTGQLRVTESEIKDRKKEIRELEAQIGAYQNRLNLAPVREQQLAALTRNYNQSRTNYESLLAKKLQSQMATNLEKRQQGELFRILDPPSLPQTPYFPQRWKFALGGLAAGAFIGLAAVIVMEAVDARVYSEQDVQGFGQLILGTVPPMLTPHETAAISRANRAKFAVASGMLVTIPILTLLTFLKG